MRSEILWSDFYERNRWRGRESRSGRGSDRDQTKIIERAIPAVVKETGAKTVLDLPCGDFNWMQGIEFPEGVEYSGADVVPGVIAANRQISKGAVIFFWHDIVEDPLPPRGADLIICRDLLGHLSWEQAHQAIKHLKGGAEWLLTTTYPGATNVPIKPGGWYGINLRAEPFNFGPPVALIHEHSTIGSDREKHLGLWSFP